MTSKVEGGVEQDYASIIESAKQGDAAAQCDLGLMYYHGNSVPQNYKRAIQYYTKSAKQGYAKAQHDLGLIYSNGTGLEMQDYKQAYIWLNLAVCNGFEAGRSIRDDIKMRMSLDDIEEAQDIAQRLFDSNYKDS